ncbi:MAG: hypothetical protein CMQ75_00760 [Gammaproteobacteria bacterium]|nr:hypothetical protein [Gammaproteobacteria bacterium]|tara:strand:- start:5309 stop:5542 length:234 start_codon:yes stop_codon:yes gene_type:complete
MTEDIIYKKLNFKARRGMKETTYIANKIINDYERLSSNEIKELEELLDLNDQEMFDLIFKDNLNFEKRFPNIKRYVK